MKNIERLYIFQQTKTIHNRHYKWDSLHHLGTSIESSKLSPIVIATCSTSRVYFHLTLIMYTNEKVTHPCNHWHNVSFSCIKTY
jgi:uncharacterized membrane protein